MMLVLRDDAGREYACGPANGLPDREFGTFQEALMEEAKQKGWVVISMKSDWARVFAFDEKERGCIAQRQLADCPLNIPSTWRSI